MTLEGIRQLIELAVAYGRSKQRPETGFIHYGYHCLPQNERDTIPILENFLFALALLRMRTAEAIIEAKTLLDKLLYFQSYRQEKNETNFPVYLHQYPQCYNKYTAISLLPIIYWTLKQFHQVIGSELRKRLESTTEALLNHSLNLPQEKPIPYPIALKIALAAKAFGELWNRDDLTSQANERVNTLLKLCHPSSCTALYSSQDLADILISLQMGYHKISSSPWNHLWKWISQTWHRQTCTYTGPAFKEMQLGEEPFPTVYDLYLGYFSGVFSARSLSPHVDHLKGALIQPVEDSLPPLMYPLVMKGEIEGEAWEMWHDKEIAYSFIKRKKRYDPSTDKGLHPLRLLWGNSKRTHTLSCQGGNGSEIDVRSTPSGILMDFLLAEPAQLEEREKNRDVTFYIDKHEELTLTVEGDPSTTFYTDNEISLQDKEWSCSIRFLSDKTEGTSYMGHLMRGNRPSQTYSKEDHMLKAFDWQIFLRAIHRTHPIHLQVEFKFRETDL